MTIADTVNHDAARAETYAHDANLFRGVGMIREAAQFQELAAEWAASAMFNRLLLIHGDVDAAEAAFDAP